MTDKQIITKSQMIMRIAELSANLVAKEQECEFNNLRIIQLQETLSQYETDLSTKDCIVETCKAQYKELEAENDELKRQHQADKGLITSIGKQNYQLLQEYDKLKEEKQGLIKDWEEKKNLAYEIACKNEKLKQTLTEIKKIAEDESYIGFWDEQISKILQKISEVEECKP